MKTVDVEINVTQDHISRGKPSCPTVCPVALAILEHTLPTITVSVVPHRVAIWTKTDTGQEGDDMVMILLPQEAGQFISNIDNRRDCSPISFTIPIPTRFLKNKC